MLLLASFALDSAGVMDERKDVTRIGPFGGKLVRLMHVVVRFTIVRPMPEGCDARLKCSEGMEPRCGGDRCQALSGEKPSSHTKVDDTGFLEFGVSRCRGTLSAWTIGWATAVPCLTFLLGRGACVQVCMLAIGI